MDQTQQRSEEAKGSLLYKAETLTVLCQLVAGLFRFALDEEATARLCSIDILGDDEDFVLTHEGCSKGIHSMQEYCKTTDLPALLLEASNDFHALLVGPHKLRAAPWSSVYMDKGGLLFGPTAQKVKGIFSQLGFAIPEGTAEPSDHIAYEWQFLADLQKKIVLAWSDDDEKTAHETIPVLGDFFDSCFSPWVIAFCDKVEKNATTDFYRGLAVFSAGLWSLEQDLIRELQSTISEDLEG